MVTNSHPEELDQGECLALLATVSVGRVGISSGALPAILPVNFILSGHDILFRTVPGIKLHAALTGSVVAFEADQLGSATTESWSVLVRGIAEEVTHPTQRAALERLVADSWAFDGDADHLVRVPATIISGQRIRPTPNKAHPGETTANGN
ncbi:MAG: pyridoxamine 5'-phosphate oxidase family protein [Acidimicrobiaceae bacterium]|nr:pyridoxamine 5'-phosphate oxidase family protein [Acidimicrobiaceae bacterium]